MAGCVWGYLSACAGNRNPWLLPPLAAVASVSARSHFGCVNFLGWRSCLLARILKGGIRASPLAFSVSSPLRLRPSEPARILGAKVSFLRARSHSRRVEYPMCRPCDPAGFLSSTCAGNFSQVDRTIICAMNGRKQVLQWAQRPSPDVCNAILVVLNTWPSREVDHAARKDALLFYGDERQAGEDGQRL